MTKAEAIEVYKATDFQSQITPTQTLHLRAEQLNPELDQFLDQYKTWVYITAWNPNSQDTDPTTNKLRNQELEKELQEKQLPYYHGAGVPDVGDWQPEASFLALGITKEEALELGAKYVQRAVVWGRAGEVPELIFCLGE